MLRGSPCSTVTSTGLHSGFLGLSTEDVLNPGDESVVLGTGRSVVGGNSKIYTGIYSFKNRFVPGLSVNQTIALAQNCLHRLAVAL